MTAKKKKKGGGIFWKLLFLVALCVFCFSMYQLVNIYLGYKKGVDEYHAVAEATTVQSSEPLEIVEEKKDEEGNLIPEEELTVNPPEVDFDALKAINDDVVGWLELEAIPSISYPIAQGEDNEYYLHRTIKKTYNFAGSVFIDSTNASDFSDPYSLLYGHHMDYDAMFGGLDHFTNEGYFDEHRSGELWISGSEYYDLTVVSCLVTDAYDEHVFRVTPEDNDLASLYDYLEDQSVFIADDLDKSEGKHLLGLSTCTNAGTNERTVIFCTINKLHEKEDIDETSD